MAYYRSPPRPQVPQRAAAARTLVSRDAIPRGSFETYRFRNMYRARIADAHGAHWTPACADRRALADHLATTMIARADAYYVNDASARRHWIRKALAVLRYRA